jgi:hypothetical protein
LAGSAAAKIARIAYFEIVPRNALTCSAFSAGSRSLTLVKIRMGKEHEYRNHAASLLDLATRAANNDDKGRLLAISEAWLNLADKLSRLAKRRKATERLGREVFSETLLAEDRPEAD